MSCFQPVLAERLPRRFLHLRMLMVCLPILLVNAGCSHLGNWMHNGFKVGPDYGKPAALALS